MVVNACHHGTGEVVATRPEVQVHAKLPDELEASLRNIRPRLPKKESQREGEEGGRKEKRKEKQDDHDKHLG